MFRFLDFVLIILNNIHSHVEYVNYGISLNSKPHSKDSSWFPQSFIFFHVCNLDQTFNLMFVLRNKIQCSLSVFNDLVGVITYASRKWLFTNCLLHAISTVFYLTIERVHNDTVLDILYVNLKEKHRTG